MLPWEGTVDRRRIVLTDAAAANDTPLTLANPTSVGEKGHVPCGCKLIGTCCAGARMANRRSRLDELSTGELIPRQFLPCGAPLQRELGDLIHELHVFDPRGGRATGEDAVFLQTATGVCRSEF